MFIETIPEDAATGAVADYYRHQRESWGFLPNYALAFGSRPDVAQAWNQLNLAIRGGNGYFTDIDTVYRLPK